jgi:hypothetical protein
MTAPDGERTSPSQRSELVYQEDGSSYLEEGELRTSRDVKATGR